MKQTDESKPTGLNFKSYIVFPEIIFIFAGSVFIISPILHAILHPDLSLILNNSFEYFFSFFLGLDLFAISVASLLHKVGK